MQGYNEPVYLISVVAKNLDIHPQTLRQYEREGLVNPDRTAGRMRLYSQHDVERIKMILALTRDMGVNLAGVDVVFQLKEQIEEYEKEIEKLEKHIKRLSSSSLSSNSLVKKRSKFDIILLRDTQKDI
ncbi:MAG: MerR family transcriptional regulator [Campylobacter sp.]|nr:MerR family transcriptional regulator [Campylobacter sp.]